MILMGKKKSWTNYVRFPVSGFAPDWSIFDILFIISFSNINNEYLWWVDMSLKSPRHPDPVLVGKSGFLKTSFLKSTLHEKFFSEIFLSEKIVLGSGFTQNWPFFRIFFVSPFRYTQTHYLSWSPMSQMSPRLFFFSLFLSISIIWFINIYIINLFYILLCEILVWKGFSGLFS